MICPKPDQSVWISASLIAVGLLLVAILITSIGDYGVTWDEAEINFPAARRQSVWFQKWFQGELSLNEASVREYFETESDHPSLPRTMMALSRLACPETVSDRVALAIPTALWASFASVTVAWVLYQRYGWLSAIIGSIALAFHPRWFAHSHFAAYDLPIAVIWFIAAMAFYHAITAGSSSTKTIPGWKDRSLWCAALLTALAFSIKLHAFFLPFPLLLWGMLVNRRRTMVWLAMIIVLCPIVYLATQPYLWWNTWERLFNRFLDYHEKWPIRVFYLGNIYPGNTPWHYPWVMLLVTMPVTLLVPLAFAMLAPFTPKQQDSKPPNERNWWWFLVMNLVTVPLIFSWKSPYDGIRLLLVALPFVACLAGTGWFAMGCWIKARFQNNRGCYLTVVLTLFLAGWTIKDCHHFHPYQLSYYSPLVGGLPGANRIGFETTYWGESVTPELLSPLAAHLPAGAAIVPLAFDNSILHEYQKHGQLPADWTFDKSAKPHAFVLQYRQGFFGPTEALLSQSPELLLSKVEVDGIPLSAVYRGQALFRLPDKPTR